jgi:hypothetical protein
LTLGPASTNGNGRFILEGVPPGRYYIFAAASAAQAETAVYHPGATDLTKAAVVTLAGGQTIPGLDFPLVWPVAEKVTGRVTVDPREKGAASTVRLTDGPQAFETAVAPDGSFEFQNVPRGEYIVRASSRSGANVSTKILVEDRGAFGIEMSIPWTAKLCGLVMVEDGGPAPLFRIAMRDAEGKVRGSATVPTGVGCVSRTGERYTAAFAVGLHEGEYRVEIGDLAGVYEVRALTYGAVDLLRNPLIIGGEELQTMRVTLRPLSTARVSGNVIGYSTTNPDMARAIVKLSGSGLPILTSPVAPVALSSGSSIGIWMSRSSFAAGLKPRDASLSKAEAPCRRCPAWPSKPASPDRSMERGCCRTPHSH